MLDEPMRFAADHDGCACVGVAQYSLAREDFDALVRSNGHDGELRLEVVCRPEWDMNAAVAAGGLGQRLKKDAILSWANHGQSISEPRPAAIPYYYGWALDTASHWALTLTEMATIACDAQSLIDSAACLECAVPPGIVGAIEIGLLNQISGLNLTADQLVALGSCYQCKIPPGMQGAIIIGLLCAIANK